MDDATLDHLLEGLRQHDWRNQDPTPKLLQLVEKISPRTPAMLVFARKLTLYPHDMTRNDQDVVRHEAGLTDAELLDLVQVVGYFNYANRIVAGLDVKLGVGEGAPGL